MKTTLLIAIVLLLTLGVSAQTEQTLLTFTGANGTQPLTGLIQDAKANLYGATYNGGANGTGMVYKLKKNAKGKWQQTILYNFGAQPGADGCDPQMPYLAIDKHGHLYGTTPCGGAHNQGTVFGLSPGKPFWREMILYSFTGGNDGAQPMGGVTLDSEGNLYGTTNLGGGSQNCYEGCGVVFELSPGKKKTWNFSVPHAFTSYPSGAPCGVYDGANPYRTTLAIDTEGNIFGTTTQGGDSCDNAGAVWELSPLQGGGWNYSVIHAMNEVKGDASPYAGGVLDSQDNFYFTVASGNIFELAQAQDYAEQLLYEPSGNGVGGAYDTVTFDKSGNLYWTTQSGYEQEGDDGGAYELSPNGQGGWNFTVLNAFPPAEGTQPWAGVMVDASGNLYGTCSMDGGSQGDAKGTVWEITP